MDDALCDIFDPMGLLAYSLPGRDETKDRTVAGIACQYHKKEYDDIYHDPVTNLIFRRSMVFEDNDIVFFEITSYNTSVTSFEGAGVASYVYTPPAAPTPEP